MSMRWVGRDVGDQHVGSRCQQRDHSEASGEEDAETGLAG